MKNKTLSEKIAKALEYYVNDTTKRCTDGERCYYSGKSTKINTKGCVVGQFLTPKQRLFADHTGGAGVEGLIIESKIATSQLSLPKIIINNVLLFSSLQGFHDNDNNWETSRGKGISEEGKSRLTRIIKEHKLDISAFNYCLSV